MLKEKIKKIIELDKNFLKKEKHKFGRTPDEIKGYECAFKFQLERLKSLLNEKEKPICKHKNKDIEIDEKRFFCKDCGEWINCEDLILPVGFSTIEKKIIVRCKHCGYEKEYKTKNKEECIVKSKGHKPHHKFVIIKNENSKP